VNSSLKECVKAGLGGILDYIKKFGWVNGRMANDNVKVWMEKLTVKNLALRFRRLQFIQMCPFLEVSL